MKKSINEKEQCVQTDVMQSVILPNELRIGNLVECFGTREIIAIKKHKIKVQHESKYGNFIIEWCPITSLSLEPIPLTEEWLLKLGFSEIGGCNEKDFTNGDYNIFINSIGEVNFLFFREGDWYQKISYVHQLQNLYFALTGSELTVA